MEDLLIEQEEVVGAIKRTLDNFKKLGVKNYTPAVTRNRLAILQEIWTRCQSLHAQIRRSATSKDKADLSYFKDETFKSAEKTSLPQTI